MSLVSIDVCRKRAMGCTEPAQELSVCPPVIQIENEGVDECLPPQQREVSACPPSKRSVKKSEKKELQESLNLSTNRFLSATLSSKSTCS